MSRRAAEAFATLICLLAGAFFVWESLKLGVGELSEPGPGMLPAFSASLLALLSLFNLAGVLFKGSDAEPIMFNRVIALKLFGAVASVVAMAVLMPRIGFFASSGAMLFFLFYFIASLPITRAAMMTVAATTINYVVFAILLKVPFP